MILLNDYLHDPCGTLSIPYWKAKDMILPDYIKVVHERDFASNYLVSYDDKPYFRLLHSLNQIEKTEADRFEIKTAEPLDIPLIVEIINRSYNDLSVTQEQIVGYTKTRVLC